MNYWLDTEFIESGRGEPLDLISIGIVAGDDREYYAENRSADLEHVNEWVKGHVLPSLVFTWKDTKYPLDIAVDILNFVGDDPNPEFWGWCCGFDYVIVSQLLGFNLWPQSWPYYFRDIQQAADERGIVLESQPDGNHNALEDARWIRHLHGMVSR